LSKSKAQQYGINGGVVVKNIKDGGPFSQTRMQDGFIITSVNGIDVTTVEELAKVLANISGTARLEGMYPGSDTYVYPLELDN
jgi:S1-C subfamily serine protease